MGMVYDTEFQLQIKSTKEREAIDLMREFAKNNPNTGFVNEDTLEDLMRLFITDKYFTHTSVPYKEEYIVHEFGSSFEASYGWEMVMLSMFAFIAPALEDDSQCYIDCDNDYDLLVIKNGKAIWLH